MIQIVFYLVLNLLSTPDSGDNAVTISTNLTYQTMNGFGGAFTDSTGISLNKLSEAARENAMRFVAEFLRCYGIFIYSSK